MVSIEFQTIVKCGEIYVTPGDYLVCDQDGVVVIPKAYINKVLEKIKMYAKKEKIIIADIKKINR